MANAVILLLLVALLVVGVKSYAKKLSRGCCGAGGLYGHRDRKKRVKGKGAA